jgi:hypothetical protein
VAVDGELTEEAGGRESSCPDVSLTGGSSCKWSLHEGEWTKPFGPTQCRKREVGQWWLLVNRGSGR